MQPVVVRVGYGSGRGGLGFGCEDGPGFLHFGGSLAACLEPGTGGDVCRVEECLDAGNAHLKLGDAIVLDGKPEYQVEVTVIAKGELELGAELFPGLGSMPSGESIRADKFRNLCRSGMRFQRLRRSRWCEQR